jgi:uncharacterized membrane protein
MSKQSLEQIFEKMTPEIVFKWLIWIFAVATVAIAVVFSFYFLNFNFNYNLSSQQLDWGIFGDFIGGTLNPILSFFSLIALLLTIIFQSKELESTRKELFRSTSAQESTEKMLQKQSKTLARQQFSHYSTSITKH